MKKSIYLVFIVFLIMISGPIATAKAEESNLEEIQVIPIQSTGIVTVGNNDAMLLIDHEIRDQSVFIECFVNQFHFTKEKVGATHQEGEGHIRLYINDEHVETLFEPAFIINDLPKGKYEIKVVIVKNDRSSYDMEETIQVTI
ncbi:hypothetical protein ACFFHM_21800 [Halalkalibacter kiskunsagensis]|uniref:DUF4625 domain-containing protein n=1 Tax=Halalkalibacter kiskunsagensis TaxID=1548599 RepID=A0ABV6KJH5_9BACI